MIIVMYFHQDKGVKYPDVFHFSSEAVAESWVDRHRYKKGPNGKVIQGGWGGKFVISDTIDPTEADNPDKLLGFDFPQQRVI